MGRHYRYKRVISILLVLFLSLQGFAENYFVIPSNAQTGLVITDSLNLRSLPGTASTIVGKLSTNAKVEILESVSGNDGYIWYKVNSAAGTGYLRSDFVNLNVTYNSADADFEAYLNSQGFPESYKNDLRGLHQKHPNWIFTAQHTGLDWDTVVREESKIGRNLVYTDNISSWKSTEEGAFDWVANYWPGFDGSVWVAASREIIEHYLDPRNFLTESYIFQFQKQTYDPALQTREGLEGMLEGTFLDSTATSQSGGSSSGSGPGQYVQTGSSNGSGPAGSDTVFTGPVADAGTTLKASVFHLLGGITAEANWEKKNDRWYYIDDQGKLYTNGWFWIDGNKDGVSECYYFDSEGFMAYNCKVDEYQVNEDGQWIVNGTVQKKYAGSTSSSSGSSGITYADLIMKAAEESGVSPYVLAAMIIQEQGTDGTSPLISGTNASYYGYYNFYNIGAYEHDGMSAVEAGLRYASESGNGNRPWNSIEKGIVGGAVAYGANYTDAGQDTFYLKKFNVQGDNLYNHQYMTNVVAAAQEGAKIADAYSAQIKESALTFKIPVYTGMPEKACELPVKNGNPNNRLSLLQADGWQLSPAFHMHTEEYTLSVDSSVSSINISAAAIDSHAVIAGAGTQQLSDGANTFTVTVTAENGDVKEYRLNVTRQPGGSTSGTSGPSGPSMISPESSSSVSSSHGPVIGSSDSSSAQTNEINVSNSATDEQTGRVSEVYIEISRPPM